MQKHFLPVAKHSMQANTTDLREAGVCAAVAMMFLSSTQSLQADMWLSFISLKTHRSSTIAKLNLLHSGTCVLSNHGTR